MGDLTNIPGVGKRIEKHLINIGYNSVDSLKGADPTELYEKHNIFLGYTEDRCLLYTFRCAVYYANNKKHDKRLLKWWNWKD